MVRTANQHIATTRKNRKREGGRNDRLKNVMANTIRNGRRKIPLAMTAGTCDLTTGLIKAACPKHPSNKLIYPAIHMIAKITSREIIGEILTTTTGHNARAMSNGKVDFTMAG
jgi:hypothetical protein